MKKQRFLIVVRGQRIIADYTPNWPYGKPAKRYGDRLFATQHIEFKSKGANPTSETGYRSHFIVGTRKQLGITDKNIRSKIIKLAESIAAERKIRL